MTHSTGFYGGSFTFTGTFRHRPFGEGPLNKRWTEGDKDRRNGVELKVEVNTDGPPTVPVAIIEEDVESLPEVVGSGTESWTLGIPSCPVRRLCLGHSLPEGRCLQCPSPDI